MGRKGNQFKERNLAKFVYDVSVDIATTNTAVSLGTLPDNSIVIGGFYHVITTFTDFDGGDNTTIALGVTGTAAAFFAATGCASYTAGLLECIDPGNGAATGGAMSKTLVGAAVADTFLLNASNVEVLLTIGNDVAITAGKLVLWLEYVVSE